MCNPSQDSEGHSEEPKDRPEEHDGSEERGRWTSYQKWTLGLAASGVVATIAIGAAQFLAVR